jgi:hypothetical protein
MHAHHDAKRRRQETALLVALAPGLVSGLLVLFFVALPTGKLLSQWPLYAPLVQMLIVVKLLSPLLCFALAAGWAWVLLALWESLRTSRQKDSPRISEQARPISASAQMLADPPRLPLLSEPPTRRPLAAPPLFQLDPGDPEASGRLSLQPPLSPSWWTSGEQALSQGATRLPHGEGPGAKQEEAGASEPRKHRTREDSIPGSIVPAAQAVARISQNGTTLASDAPPVAISLLKRVRVELLLPDGTARDVRLHWGEHAIRHILLAYIAWRRGAPVDRDKLLEQVVAKGRRKEYTVDQLSEVFSEIKKQLREDLKKAVSELNSVAGAVLVPPTVDFFSTEPGGFYLLHPSCRVRDLDTIEQYHAEIERASKEGVLDEKLDGSLPPWVIDACEKLLAAYPGDFLEELLSKFPEEFGAWVREPLTRYRDFYLEALWIRAMHESALSRSFAQEQLTEEQNAEQRRLYQGKAAQSYVDYAMYAIKNGWDRKLRFAYRAGKDGERIVMSQRAMRRAVVLLGQMGRTDLIDRHYLAYKEKMHTLSEGHWRPDPETEADVAAARKQTSSYRFSAQIPAFQQREQA